MMPEATRCLRGFFDVRISMAQRRRQPGGVLMQRS